VLSLTHLKFLVVDEADRLLRQDYHGWLPQVLVQIQAAGSSSSSGGSSQYQLLPELHPGTGNVLPGGQGTASAAAWGPAVYSDLQTSSLGFGSSSLQDATPAGGSSSSSSSRHVLKLVVSATLTRDPSKLMRLELCCPRYIALTDVARRYMLPPALEQYRLVVPAQHKPLALVGLLHRLGQARTVIFASSLDMTHK
jgi:ATP-dependent RNA helicase DDX51/DBP6